MKPAAVPLQSDGELRPTAKKKTVLASTVGWVWGWGEHYRLETATIQAQNDEGLRDAVLCFPCHSNALEGRH